MHTRKYLLLTNVSFNANNVNPDDTKIQLINQNGNLVTYRENELLDKNSCACTLC